MILNRESILDDLVEKLDIPPSYYELAKQRAVSLEEWLLRPASSVRQFSPEVYPQGSFRYGTVIRPIAADGYYDLDLVVIFQLSTASVTQEKLKSLLGAEIQAYGLAKNFNEEAEEKPRCWRLNYADEVGFHIDILPGVPASEIQLNERLELSVASELARHEISITDTRHECYSILSPNWYSSNPRGFAKWFEANNRPYAESRLQLLLENRAYASIEEIPPYEWKTVLQRVVQVLKRHRDVFFSKDQTYAPISMIITTLATHAYEGESSPLDALDNVVRRMPDFIQDDKPRVQNPINPKEDFADKWSTDEAYELQFRLWHMQLSSDVQQIRCGSDRGLLQESIQKGFNTKVEVRSAIPARTSKPTPALAASPLLIPTGPRPWGV